MPDFLPRKNLTGQMAVVTTDEILSKEITGFNHAVCSASYVKLLI